MSGGAGSWSRGALAGLLAVLLAGLLLAGVTAVIRAGDRSSAVSTTPGDGGTGTAGTGEATDAGPSDPAPSSPAQPGTAVSSDRSSPTAQRSRPDRPRAQRAGTSAPADDLPQLEALAEAVQAGVQQRAATQRRQARRQQHQQHQAQAAPSASPAPVATTATFRVGSFNILGATHTAPGGNKKGYAPAAARMPWTLALIRRAGLDVVGLQEFQATQYAAFRRATAGTWSVFPGVSRERKAVQNSIAFRTDVWDFEQGLLVDVPYFHGRPFPMPLVLLTHRASGHEVWFVNVHNPASTRGDASRHRARGIAIEAALVNRLHREGTPVVLTGDFNAREEAFCPLVGRTELEAANGGSVVAGRCRPPADPRIDWIFATSDFEVLDHVRDQSALVRRATDHPMVHAALRLTGVPD
jgi:endonuclease/exonuclease/phosphatase family metal-dependent hydrolase